MEFCLGVCSLTIELDEASLDVLFGDFCVCAGNSCSLFLKILEIEETDGTFIFEHTPSVISFSLISHANIPGSKLLNTLIASTTSLVVTRGFEPPIVPGATDPVSFHFDKI